MKKIFAIALALMLAIPALAFADGNDVQIVVQGAAEVTAAPDHRRGAGGHEQDHRCSHPKAARIGRSGR